MPFQRQPQNFDFIAQAGQQAAQAITAFDTAKKMKIDDAQASQAHDMLLEAAKEKYKQATGTTDEVKATAFAARYFQPKYKGETALNAISRWEKAESQFDTALTTLKVKDYHAKSAGGQAVPQGAYPAGGTMEMKQNATPEQARTARMAGQVTPTTEMARPAGFGYGELPGDRPEAGTMPPMTSEERYNTAQKQGLLQDPTVLADVTMSGRQELAGRQFPAGTTSEQVYREEMQQPVLDEMGQKYHTQFPSQKDLMTNDRLNKARVAKEKNDVENRALKARLARLAERKLGSDERRQIITDKARNENELIRLGIQVKAIEAGITKANKDLMGGLDPDAMQKQFDELQELRETLALATENQQAYISLLGDKGGSDLYPTTPPAVSPVQAPRPVAPVSKPKFKVINVQ